MGVIRGKVASNHTHSILFTGVGKAFRKLTS